MIPPLTLNRSMLSTYQTCQRQFQLRYVDKLAWPNNPFDEQFEQARILGERFHQLIHRFFLGLNIESLKDEDPTLAIWLKRFLVWSESLPPGKRSVELNLAVPIASHYLTGRLDLTILSEDTAHIYDWKTAIRPQEKERLWQDMQTRIYLALVAEGGDAIGRSFNPANISLTYWYPLDPPVEIRLDYSQKKHEKNWRILEDLVSGIEWLMRQDATWPKTVNLNNCRRCPYQIICDRQVGSIDFTDWEQADDVGTIEPYWP